MIDQAQIHALKQRRAIFEASGLHEKAKAIDAEIAKLRNQADKVEVAEHVEQAADDEIPLQVLEPSMETAQADLSGVETVDAKRPPSGARKTAAARKKAAANKPAASRARKN